MSEMRDSTEGPHSAHPAHSPAPAAGSGSAATPAATVGYGLPAGAYPGLAAPSSPLVRLGGAMGIAACAVGLLVLVAACMGLRMALVLSLIPVGLSLPGVVITILGAITQKDRISEDTHVLHALFATIAGLLGGLLEMAAWLHWPIFPR